MSYIADEHRDWHTWNRVPMGPSGGSCPWDACGWADDYEPDYEPTEPSKADEEGWDAREEWIATPEPPF